ncbi:glycogen debranching protein GlgX [Aliagarivorans marinus]|uniref:glycogen debranching protein GlgX n=1 Tax=Aliagarivorans marinus TaxID=561965 RepID=UPI00041CCFAA|nr:glycogen debranching protein GlgX [Aliagarivorans marinus]
MLKTTDPMSVSDPELFRVTIGSATPLGAQLDQAGCNFAVHGGEAKYIELCLFDECERQIAQFILPGKHGYVHFGHVPGVRAGQLYAFRAYGDYQPEHGLRYDQRKLLLDPYAKAINRPILWDAVAYDEDSAAMLPKCVVVDDDFDWQGVARPGYSLSQTILYETHVRGFSKLHPEVPTPYQGTYLGMCSKPAIDHLKQLGVTAVQLLPVASFMSEPRLKGLGLSNYWGYNPLLFMAPDPRYAISDAVSEFKQMVRELHRAGIEVILDVVYNHTAESGDDGPSLSFRGLDNRRYYLFDHVGDNPNYHHYTNNTGCGNSVSFDHDVTLQLVLDTLRYWYCEMGVDGFRFDLAVSLGREHNRFKTDASFFRALRQDPSLKGVKLIAEPWDIGYDGYQLGRFPSNWMECNDRYRDNLRGFWRGDRIGVGELATRLMGSRDFFLPSRRSIHTSVNYICYHDGFTLHDLVSYEQRHNHANGEANRDGHGHNLSANYGEEGESDNAAILELRFQQKRNLIMCLMLSQGVPHFLGGDELSRTQRGNNNAYCQNNPISWYDWQLDERESQFLEFVQQLIKLRRDNPVFHQLKLASDTFERKLDYQHAVHWYREDGNAMHQSDWHCAERQSVMVEIVGLKGEACRWLWLINASEHAQKFRLPATKQQQRWSLRLDSSLTNKLTTLEGHKVTLAPRSMMLMEQQ